MSTLEENDGRERPGGKAGRGSENKVPIVAAISLNAAGHSIQAKISPVAGFTSEALADWARQHLSSGCSVLSDGLACFRSVVVAGCSHTAVVTGGRYPNNLPQFRWITCCWATCKRVSAALSMLLVSTITPSVIWLVSASFSTDILKWRQGRSGSPIPCASASVARSWP